MTRLQVKVQERCRNALGNNITGIRHKLKEQEGREHGNREGSVDIGME